MKSYLDCWIGAATALFSQALADEPVLSESLPKPLSPSSFGFAATIAGDQAGRFAVMLDGTILETPLLGEGMDQKAGWAELLREVADSAVGELQASAGKKCHIEKFEPTPGENKVSRAFQLKAGDRIWSILVRDEVREEVRDEAPAPPAEVKAKPAPEAAPSPPPSAPPPPPPPLPPLLPLSSGIELLLDVELDASLRFGCREMLLGEILDLGPGDVVQLDRHVTEPVDLIVGDKIVARGEVVLINGNFGLRVTEVAAPRKRLESIRCLF
jgi:flagellar motor switch protein FliN/FliY